MFERAKGAVSGTRLIRHIRIGKYETPVIFVGPPSAGLKRAAGSTAWKLGLPLVELREPSPSDAVDAVAPQSLAHCEDGANLLFGAFLARAPGSVVEQLASYEQNAVAVMVFIDPVLRCLSVRGRKMAKHIRQGDVDAAVEYTLREPISLGFYDEIFATWNEWFRGRLCIVLADHDQIDASVISNCLNNDGSERRVIVEASAPGKLETDQRKWLDRLARRLRLEPESPAFRECVSAIANWLLPHGVALDSILGKATTSLWRERLCGLADDDVREAFRVHGKEF